MNRIWKLCFCGVIVSLSLAIAEFSFQETVAKAIAKDREEVNDCREFVQKLANEAISIINTQNLSKDEILKKFTDLVGANFSVNKMARFAIGRHIKSLTEEEKEIFLKCFTKMLVKLYATNFEEYKSAKFMVTGHREKSKNSFLIESKVIIPAKPEIVIVWHVSCVKGGGFSITDAITNEISIRQILRAEIGGNISEKGLKKFLTEYSEKYGKL